MLKLNFNVFTLIPELIINSATGREKIIKTVGIFDRKLLKNAESFQRKIIILIFQLGS